MSCDKMKSMLEKCRTTFSTYALNHRTQAGATDDPKRRESKLKKAAANEQLVDEISAVLDGCDCEE